MVPKKVHCFFEQSGTFKNEFINLHIPAFDYDLEDNFSLTDFKVDLFKEIELAFISSPSIFDSISSEDLIFAFFPCTFFEVQQAGYLSLDHPNLRSLDLPARISVALDRLNNRTFYHSILFKLVSVCVSRQIYLIIENPFTQPNYLGTCRNFPSPDLIHSNRSLFGDYFRKPTAYWFFGFKPTLIDHLDPINVSSTIQRISGFDRSKISSRYARNFILNHILGVFRPGSQLDLF